MECIAQIKIAAHPNGMSRDGFACGYTGSHCKIDKRCKARVKDYKAKLGLDKMFKQDRDKIMCG